MEFVNGVRIIPYEMENNPNVPNHQAVESSLFITKNMIQLEKSQLPSGKLTVCELE